MRILPLTMLMAAGLLGACSQEPQVNLRGEAEALAKIIAHDQDHVTAAELSDWIIKDQRDFELVDIRVATDYEAGHIEGARHIPLSALLSDSALAELPEGRKVVLYSNGTAHAHAATLLLRLIDREAYALLGGYNYWLAYLNDPASAGVAEMDPVERAKYQAVACRFEGEYVAAAGLTPQGAPDAPAPAAEKREGGEADPLGLGLGLGTEDVREAVKAKAEDKPVDPLGLGLEHGLGGEAGQAVQQGKQPKPEKGTTKKLIIRAEC